MKNIEAIKWFEGDDLAASTWKNKYAAPGEKTPDDTIDRMATEFAKSGAPWHELTDSRRNSLSEYGKRRSHLSKEDIVKLIGKLQKVIPQGSVQSQLGNRYSIGSLSNCFVVKSPADSYGGIFRTDQQLGQIMKRRGGGGVDISTLRPAGTPTNNVAKTTTGAVSFMERFSATTREVGQGGRRGALMISLNINHPDSPEFATIKSDLTKVTGANISLRMNDEFMKAAANDEDYILRWPMKADVHDVDIDSLEYNDNFQTNLLSGEIAILRKVKAKELWETVITAAHNNGEPGVLNWDRVLEGPDGVYPDYIPISTNPCGEIPIPANDSCRLIAVNLVGFVKNKFHTNAWFDEEAFYKAIYESMVLSDTLVDLELKHVSAIIQKIKSDPETNEDKSVELNLWTDIFNMGLRARRTGLGLTGLGDALAMMNVKYSDKEGRLNVEAIMKTKLRAELDATIDMAIIKGPFSGWDNDKEFSVNEHGLVKGENPFYQMLLDEFPEQAYKMMVHGRRNVSWSTIAPTGTISMLAGVTSGVEPLFQPFYMRRRKINANDPEKPIPDFVDDNGDEWTEHAVLHYWFNMWVKMKYGEGVMTKEQLEDAFKESPWYGETANDISARDRVDMQAILQRYTTHSISSTVNLPNDVDVDTVRSIYEYAHLKKLKGITVYRDGSRDGVLFTEKNEEQDFSPSNGFKRPDEVETRAWTATVAGKKYSIFVGTINGYPYELFGYEGGTTQGTGKMLKEAKGEYYFQPDTDGSKQRIVTGRMTPEQELATRLISRAFRHGSDLIYVVEDLEKSAYSMFSFPAAIAKVLKNYIKDGTETAKKCINPECTGDGSNVIYEEGCSKCLDCGAGACG